MSVVDVVLLAGAPAGPELSPAAPKMSRAMIPLGDKTMLQWVVDALRGANSIGRIIAVGDVAADGLDLVIEPGDNLIVNIRHGIKAASSGGVVLVVCSDIPMLSSEAVEDFLCRAPADVELAYPIIRKEDCAKHPELKRTYLKTGDGEFTGGNMMLLSSEFVDRNYSAIQRAYEARKRPIQLACMIGLGVLVRLLVARIFPGALRIFMLEKAAAKMLGGKVAAVVSAYPEIGEDVDKASDLNAVLEILRPTKTE